MDYADRARRLGRAARELRSALLLVNTNLPAADNQYALAALDKVLNRVNDLEPDRCRFFTTWHVDVRTTSMTPMLGACLLLSRPTDGQRPVHLVGVGAEVMHCCDVVYGRPYGGEWEVLKSRDGLGDVDLIPIHCEHLFMAPPDHNAHDAFRILARGGLLP